MSNRPSDPAPQKKKGGCGFFVILFLAILIAGCIYFLSIIKELNVVDFTTEDAELGITSSETVPEKEPSSVPADTEPVARPSADSQKEIVNIALFGVDQREGETAFRSDAIMILTIDEADAELKLSSVMRDTLVEIEGYGPQKITKAYYFGGPELAVKTLNQNFDLNIREFATVNFQQMAAIIDAVGGVEIELSEAERKNANQSIDEQSRVAGLEPDYIESAGLQTLNGTQAVAYARIRYVGNADFERTSRQREVLRKIFDKALAMNPLQYPEFARKFLPTVETSLDLADILSLADIMLKRPTLEDVRFPTNADLIGDGVIMVGGESCLNVNIDTMADKLHSFIYDDIDPTTDADRLSNGQ